MKLDYDKAFIENREIATESGTTTFKIHQIGELIVSSGFIVACDPFVFYDDSAFKTPIPVGIYPVILSVAVFEDDQRIAYAKLKVSNESAVRWELALLPEQNADSLKEDEFFGYPVDAGTGCFMDAETAKVFSDTSNEDYSDFMIKEMEKNYVDTWDWANFNFNNSKGNLITFKSGWGDGVYGSYFGFDKDNNITCLVTDFVLFEDAEVYSEE